MIKSKKVIQKMKLLESGVTVFRGVLSETELIHLREMYTRLEADHELQFARSVVGDKKNQITKIPTSLFDEVDRIVRPKLGLLPYKYESMNFYKIQNPYHMHSDTGKDNTIAYKQGVIPLYVNPPGSKPCTVIFNERVYFSSEYAPIDRANEKPSSYQPFYNIGTWDPSYYEGWIDEHRISEEDCKRVWYGKWEYWKENYKGFSVNTIYEWQLGDILIFDRSMLHAAGLLAAGGTDSKSGLLFLTYLDENDY